MVGLKGMVTPDLGAWKFRYQSPPLTEVISLGDADLTGELLDNMVTNSEITEKEAHIVKDAFGAWLDEKCAEERVKLGPKAKEMLANLLISISRRIAEQTS